MYDSDTLNMAIEDYLYHCGDRPPTRQGLADWLSISHQTVNNVINGTYNGFKYGDKPHVNRIIANKDFMLIRALFTQKERKEE